MRNDNLKRTGQLRNVRVESGFVTVCMASHVPCKSLLSVASILLAFLSNPPSPQASCLYVSLLQRDGFLNGSKFCKFC